MLSWLFATIPPFNSESLNETENITLEYWSTISTFTVNKVCIMFTKMKVDFHVTKHVLEWNWIMNKNNMSGNNHLQI